MSDCEFGKIFLPGLEKGPTLGNTPYVLKSRNTSKSPQAKQPSMFGPVSRVGSPSPPPHCITLKRRMLHIQVPVCFTYHLHVSMPVAQGSSRVIENTEEFTEFWKSHH